MSAKQKSIYISKSDILVCSCGTIKKVDEIIYKLSSYEKKSLRQFATICSTCISNNSIRRILANSPLIFFSYEKNPAIPNFLERIDI